ncbi:MAG TPA: ATP-dependent Clp protease adaptor ClpS [Gemmataceae bacterium]
MTPSSTDAPAGTATRPEEQTETRPRLLPPYNVILENDDDHSMEFVVQVLRKVLGVPLEKAFRLMLTAHETGESVIWTGPKEVAELKVEQVRTFHEVRARDGRDLGPLGCRIEPAE